MSFSEVTQQPVTRLTIIILGRHNEVSAGPEVKLCHQMDVLTEMGWVETKQVAGAMLGLSTSLLDINKKEEKEVKLRKISKTKRLSSEQIADLFNVTAGVYII